jgi:hypothetical protein
VVVSGRVVCGFERKMGGGRRRMSGRCTVERKIVMNTDNFWWHRSSFFRPLRRERMVIYRANGSYCMVALVSYMLRDIGRARF